MTPTLARLAPNLTRAGDPARWFRTGAAGEHVRPEILATLLDGLTFTEAEVPALVAACRVEGPDRKQALRQALVRSLRAPSDPFDFGAPSAPSSGATPTMNSTTHPMNNGHHTAAVIDPAPRGASVDELVEAFVTRHRLDISQRLPAEVRQRITLEHRLTDGQIRDALTRLRQAQGVNLRPDRGKGKSSGKRAPANTRGRLTAPRPEAAAPPAAAAPDLGTLQEQGRALSLEVVTRLLRGDTSEAVITAARLLEKTLP